jgi:AmmeMemoRadiSam system protein A/AmmeMemoRadiSam system protein B
MMPILAAFAVPHPPIMRPEVGMGEEKGMQRTLDAYRAAMRRAAAYRPDTVVVTTPHNILYSDYFHISPGASAEGDFSSFRAPRLKVTARYDEAFVRALVGLCDRENLPAGTLGEKSAKLDHGTMLPLLALNEFLTDYQVVRVSLSGLSPAEHYRLGTYLSRAAEALDRRVVLIASGDLSHKLKEDGPYGFAPEGPDFDRLTTEALGRADFLSLLLMDPELSEAAGECGLRSLWIMAGALDKKAVKSELLSYEGPFGVGYAVAAFDVTGPDPTRDIGAQFDARRSAEMAARREREDAYVRLARLSLETYVTTGRTAELPEGLPDALLNARAGAFVSLHKHGALRGCIGTIEPVQKSLALEIVKNAVSASRDPRFDPVEPEELSDIVYNVDVLGESEPIRSEAELDVKRYGVIVSDGIRQGLLLPDLPGVATPREQIEIARKKAGIGPNTKVILRRFEVVRHT